MRASAIGNSVAVAFALALCSCDRAPTPNQPALESPKRSGGHVKVGSGEPASKVESLAAEYKSILESILSDRPLTEDDEKSLRDRLETVKRQVNELSPEEQRAVMALIAPQLEKADAARTALLNKALYRDRAQAKDQDLRVGRVLQPAFRISLGASEWALNRLGQFQRAGDRQGERELLEARQAVELDTKTGLRVIQIVRRDRTTRLAEVRILDGIYSGQSGWIEVLEGSYRVMEPHPND